MTHLKWIGFLLCYSLLLLACSTNDETSETGSWNIAAPSYIHITYHSVLLSTNLTDGNMAVVTKKGFCYSLTTNPTITDATVEVLGTNRALTCELAQLTPNTTYYVRAFVTLLNADPVYSPESSFTTSIESAEDLLANYEAPIYADNYTSIASWSQRSQWNLANVHDPTVMKADDGYYYMYQTDASYGNAHEGHGHFHGRRSKDLINWEYLGSTMETAPSWVKEKLNQMRNELGLAPIEFPIYGYWAPVVRKVAPRKYRMYYSIVINNLINTGKEGNDANFDGSWGERAFIGMMETSEPSSNKWEDKGYVICSASDKGVNWSRSSLNDWSAYFKWNAIDPSYVISENGTHWLVYGSWHSGIAAIQLNPETGKPLNNLGKPWETTHLANYGQLIATRNIQSRWQASEGPEIIYNPQTGYYYLFMAYDELSVAYNTRVCRSRNVTGPYVSIDGKDITAGGDIYPVVTHPYKFNNSNGWVGLSHCAVFDDGSGNWFYSSQGRLPRDIPGINASNAVMMGHVRSIRWTTSGWPVVMPERYGAVPNALINENELIGTWENIDLSYRFGQQKTATTLVLGSDHKVTSGLWIGKTWSYDAKNQLLIINGIELCIQREVDWESSPRTHTIVYAGYNGTATYWGKKTK